ncbi:MAG: heat-inducible transcription repressor HrcA [Nitrospiraceae bacterium]|nr:heat-inducible transcription repressor HrcA [Nitrospiraceae bacterium]
MAREESLSERESLILQAAVQGYITTAEPVGSRTIVKRFGLDLSPATVRNVMADLEEDGYLQQLHTSSGRVPTDQGYRYYVNHLMRVQELTLTERARIENELSARLNDADDVLRHTSQLLALVTHQTGLVKAPDEGSAEVRYIEVVLVSETRAAILIADTHGQVHTVLAPLDTPLAGDELVKLNRFLNQHLAGVSLADIRAVVHDTMGAFLNEERRLAERALQLLDMVPRDRPGQLYLQGAAQLFEQPEFRDFKHAREVMDLLGESDRLVALLRAGIMDWHPPTASVLIGSESHDDALKEISVVASPYRVGDKQVGVLGVLGPRRMPYSRLTAIVDYTAGLVSRVLTKLAG